MGRRRSWSGALGLALVVVAVFLPILSHDFVNYDDDIYVTGNLPVRDGLTPRGAWWAFTSVEESNWHPLTWLSHMLDVQLFGLRPGGHHATSLVLHLATTILLFVALGRMTGGFGRSLLVAALFGVHPLHVESVAWVSERKGLLCGLFWMLALIAYVSYVRKPGPRRLAAVAVAMVLGMLSKPVMVTFPFVLLLLDSWPLGRFVRSPAAGAQGRLPLRLLTEKLPLFACVAPLAIATFRYQRDSGAMDALATLPPAARVANALGAYVGYLRQALWPADLAVFYPHPGLEAAVGPALAAGALLVIVSLAAAKNGRTHGYPAVGWAWYLGTLLPVVGMIQVGRQAMADRYTYLPLIGPLVWSVWGAASVVGPFRSPARKRLAAVAGGLIVGTLAFAGSLQVSHWRNSESLFRHALAGTTNNDVAHHNLACALRDHGEIAEAERHFREALRIRPGYANALFNLGFIEFDRGNLQEAASLFLQGLKSAPGYAPAEIGAGFALDGLGRHAESAEHFRRALAIAPHDVFAWEGLGAALQALGDADGAEQSFLKALEIAPNHTEASYRLGVLALSRGRIGEAIRHLSRVTAADPGDARAHLALARAHAAKGASRLPAEAPEPAPPPR